MSSPVEVSVKATFEMEFVAGVRTRSPDCCMMTASEPSIVVMSLNFKSGDPTGRGAGAGAGPADEGTGDGTAAPLAWGGGGW